MTLYLELGGILVCCKDFLVEKFEVDHESYRFFSVVEALTESFKLLAESKQVEWGMAVFFAALGIIGLRFIV